jgi:3-oxoacyl-[acyl-carrier protein] reductase
MTADVTDPAACERVVAQTLAEFGRVDVLVNNAARPSWEASRPRPDGVKKFWEADLDGFHRMVQTNFIGPFHMTRLAVPPMVAAGFGRIVNISTSRSTMAAQSGSPYGACKAALEASSVLWAKDLAGTGVTVNVLLPGGASDTALIPGPIGGRAMPGFKPGKGPVGEEGKVVGGLLPPEVMAAPILWLAADESSAYTGRRIVGRDWDPDLPPDEAVARAMAPKADQPTVM